MRILRWGFHAKIYLPIGDFRLPRKDSSTVFPHRQNFLTKLFGMIASLLLSDLGGSRSGVRSSKQFKCLNRIDNHLSLRVLHGKVPMWDLPIGFKIFVEFTDPNSDAWNRNSQGRMQDLLPSSTCNPRLERDVPARHFNQHEECSSVHRVWRDKKLGYNNHAWSSRRTQRSVGALKQLAQVVTQFSKRYRWEIQKN